MQRQYTLYEQPLTYYALAGQFDRTATGFVWLLGQCGTEISGCEWNAVFFVGSR
jgi:hypothetical protein